MISKILLVNPNTVKNPPVIPIGLEYLLTALEKEKVQVDVLDLCFATNPSEELNRKLEQNSYDFVGFSIRNVDSTLFFNNEFYLPAIKELVKCAREFGLKTIIGGSGFSAMPEEILDYMGADYGIIGPGEIALLKLLNMWQNNATEEKIIDGWQYGPDSNLVHIRGNLFDYPRYLSLEGITGFETQKGCTNECPYCVEAKTSVWFKNIPNIIKEIQNLVDMGYNHFHTCDCEFNINLKYSIEFLRQLVESKIPLKWTLYMKPYPYNEEFFRLLSESNAYLITLTVDSDERTQSLNNYSYDDLAKIIDYCNKYNIKLVIDALTGYPYELLESTIKMIEFFKENRPSSVGIGFYFRIFKNTELSKLISSDKNLQMRLSRSLAQNENFLEPIFYHHLEQNQLKSLFAGDDLFKIAGLTEGVNYQLDDVKDE